MRAINSIIFLVIDASQIFLIVTQGGCAIQIKDKMGIPIMFFAKIVDIHICKKKLNLDRLFIIKRFCTSTKARTMRKTFLMSLVFSQ